MFLHDRVGWYRYWHHSPVRLPTHFLVVLLALLIGGAVIFSTRTAENPQAAAGIFADFPFQGRLTNSDGTVVANGNYDAVFKLYSVSTGGTAVWTESHTTTNQISTVDGIFNTLLGSITSLTGIDFNQDSYYLGITVGADAEMTPRIRLGAAPYAFNTDKLNGLGSTAFLQLNGIAGGQTAFGGTAASQNLVLRSTSNATKGNVIIADDGGAVGIGTATPFNNILGSVNLPVSGIHVSTGVGKSAKILLEGDDPNLDLINITGAVNAKWTHILQSTGGNLAFYGRNDAGALIQAISSPILSLDDVSGNIGIGTNTTPDFKLEIAGSVGPNADDSYDLGSSALRWRDLYLGPTSLHLTTTAGETATARDWKLNVDETNGATDGDLRIQEGSNSYFGVTTAGNIVLGSAALATTATNGFLYTPSMAGVPTGVPTSYTGRVPLTYNTASNILYFYNGGWQPVSGGGGGGITGSGAAGQVTIWSGSSAVTGDAGYLYDSTQKRLSVGTTPSTDTAAVLSIPNNKFISARNATNSGNISLIGLNSSDYLQFPINNGAANQTVFDMLDASTDNNTYFYNSSGFKNNVNVEGFLGVYNSNAHATAIATSGHIRLPNDASITSKAAGAGDISLIKLTSADYLQLGPTNSLDTTLVTVNTSGTSAFNFYNPGTGIVNSLFEGPLIVYNSDGFIGSPATSGSIRLLNNASMNAKAAGAGDISLIKLNTTDQIQLGPTSGSDTYVATASSAGMTNFIYQNPGTGVATTHLEGVLYVYNADAFAATPASTGTIRLANNSSISAKKVGAGDVSLITLAPSDQIAFGFTSGNTSAFDLNTGGETTFLFNNTNAGNRASVDVEGVLTVYDNNSLTGAATTGVIRLPNNDSINAKKVGAGDINLIKLAPSDQIAFGFTSGNTSAFDLNTGGETTFLFNNTNVGNRASVDVEGVLTVYDSNNLAGAAATGVIRLPNNDSINARNSTNTGDIGLIKLATSDQIAFGITSSNTTAFDFNSGSETTFLFNNTNAGNKAHIALEGTLTVYDNNSMTGAASTGTIRLPNLATIYGRNQANTGDIMMMKVNSSNQFESGVDIATGGDFYDTTIPASVSATTLCIAALGQIGTCSSDERLKKNISDITTGVSIIEQLSPKTYDFISGQNGQSGFLAQDVQKILPGLVTKDTGDDYLSLNYNGILAYAVKAIQEMNGRIDVIDASKAGKADSLTLTSLTTKTIAIGENATIAGTLVVGQSVEFTSTLLVKDTATFEKDVAIGGNLTVTGSILGSAQTRGINVVVDKNVTFLDVKGLALPIDSTYAVSVTPSWRTGFWVTDKKPESFTIHFDTPAPKDALVDYLIQR